MNGIYTVWLREMIKFFKSKTRVIGTLGMPLVFLLFLGNGMSSLMPGGGYIAFMAPGIVAMVILFNSFFSGMNVIFDKQYGFMKEILVAPISRDEIMIGKALGGAMTSMFQAYLLLGLIYVFGILPFDPIALLFTVPPMFLVATGFCSIGLIFATKLDDPHGFQLIMNFLIMPIFFLSTAFFPLANLPEWLKIMSMMDPLTYCVDALRGVLAGQSAFPYGLSVLVLAVFACATLFVGGWFFRQMKNA